MSRTSATSASTTSDRGTFSWAFASPRSLSINLAIACYAIAVTLSFRLEMIVFLSSAVDPRVRVMQLERAITRARQLTGPVPPSPPPAA